MADVSLLSAVISGASGIAGAFVGGRMANSRENSREEKRTRGEQAYGTVLIIAALDRFIEGCADVACDDGTSRGYPAGDDRETHAVTKLAPGFDPLTIQVDWKSFPPKLMYDILSLPLRVEQLDRALSEMQDDPPDHTEFFWARRHGYATLGIEAAGLMKRLRTSAEFSSKPPVAEVIDRMQFLKEQRDIVADERRAYQDRLANGHIELSRNDPAELEKS